MLLTAPLAILLLTMAAEIVVLSSGEGPLRMALVGAFLALAPGTAALRPLRLPLQPLAWVGLALSLSMAIIAIVASVMLYLGAWSPELGLTILALIVVILTMADLPAMRDGVTRGVRLLGAQMERPR